MRQIMKQILLVTRRELRSFFDQPTAYVLAVAFLGLGLYLSFRSLYAMSVASLRPYFDLLPWLLVVFIPAVTMRSLAEERRGRTLEWLIAQPLSETEVVAGKFLGSWLFVLITLAGTLPMAIGVLAASEADPGIMFAQYVGAALLIAQMISIGIWASSLTRNQITAFILGAFTCFALVLIGTPVVQIGLPRLIGGWLLQLSVISHFENVARGVIDLRDLLYFASTCGLFLLLAVAALGRERLSRGGEAFRRLRIGTGVITLAVLVLNLLGGYVRGRLDLTDSRLFTLSEGSREILGGLDDIVNLTVFLSDDLPQEIQLTVRDVRDLVADMRNASDGMLAVKEGRDDLAKQALIRQQEHADRVAVLEGTWQAQAQETEKLKGSLRQLNDKIEEAKRKRNLLIAKQKRAQAQKRIHETMSGLSDTSAFEAFNRMAEKIEEEERRSLAHAEVTEALAGDTLESEFLRLESGSGDADVDNRLAALKAEMGLLPSGAGEAPKRIGSGRGAGDAADSAAGDGSEADAAEGEAADEPPIREAELLEEFDRLQRGGARA